MAIHFKNGVIGNIYKDHNPPHIHLYKAGLEQRVNLTNGQTLEPKQKEFKEALHEITTNQEYFLKLWEQKNK